MFKSPVLPSKHISEMYNDKLQVAFNHSSSDGNLSQ